IDRVNSVLDALKLKGGDDAVYRKYISAISGIAVDVSDANSAWLSISGWLKSDQGGLRWLKNLFFFLVTILFFWLLSKAIGKATEKALKMHTRISNLMQDFMEGLIRRIIIAIGLIVALSALEVDIGPLLAVVGAAGFVVAFALQETLGNFASGIMILVYQPFDVGDLVDVAGVYGKVKRMNLVSTTISTLDNKVVMVPNNSIWGGVITNVTGTDLRRVDMTFGISYADDISAAQKVLEKIVVDHPRTLDDPAPIIQLNELADSSVNFICFPWVKTDDYWTVYWDITRTVKEQFDANGISIPFPQQDVHLHQIPPR
ncbi:MAG TPA: mechanosensitive ion channel domain-containing protein, partial [Tichowtungia sp.]|nr:mechanosensitive ion channel domain-containing protein [Tichowtungia sp.]